MSSGLASPQSFVEQQHSSPTTRQASFTMGHSPQSVRAQWYATPSNTFYTQPFMTTSLPSSAINRNRRTVEGIASCVNVSATVAPTPANTASIITNNNSSYNNIASRATTPTMMPSHPSNHLPTSPPPLQMNQRRLSLLTNARGVSESFTSDMYRSSSPSVTFVSSGAGDEPIFEGLSSTPSISVGAGERSIEIVLPSSLPSLEPITASDRNTNTASSSNRTESRADGSSNHDAFARQIAGMFSAPSNSSSVGSGTSTLSSISMIVTNAPGVTERNILESSRAGLTLNAGLTERFREVRNSTDAAERIAQNRSRAEQAAREAEAEEAAAFASATSVTTPVPSIRRRASKVATSVDEDVLTNESTRRTRRASCDASNFSLPERSKRTSAGCRLFELRNDVIEVNNNKRENSTADCSPQAKKVRLQASTTRKKAPSPSMPEAEEMENVENCPICMCPPSRQEICNVNGCAHTFCFSCISKWSERENTCPLCKFRFTKITRIHTQRRKLKSDASISNIKRVKQRDQRSDIVSGPALESLLASYVAGVPLPASMNGRFIMATRMNGILPMLQQHHHEQIAMRHRGLSRAHSIDNVLVDSSSEDDDTPPGIFSNLMSLISHRSLRDESIGSSTATIAPRRSEAHPLSFSYASAVAPSADVPSSGPSSSFPLFSSFVGNVSGNQSNYRSYASNVSDPSAGHGASNPLEIDDSDSDDSVEVVQVVATATSSI